MYLITIKIGKKKKNQSVFGYIESRQMKWHNIKYKACT